MAAAEGRGEFHAAFSETDESSESEEYFAKTSLQRCARRPGLTCFHTYLPRLTWRKIFIYSVTVFLAWAVFKRVIWRCDEDEHGHSAHPVEDMALSIYALTQIVTTVGYGDFAPRDLTQRLMVMGIILCSLVVLAHWLNDFAEKCLDRQQAQLQQVLAKTGNLSRALLDVKDERKQGLVNSALSTSAVFWSFVFTGTVFYATYEACSCSYGRTAIKGCDDLSYETCVKTGGQVKAWPDALYMCVVTLTTVGFGDLTPLTRLGRWLAIPWMLLGVASCAAWVSSMAAILFDKRESQAEAEAQAAAHGEVLKAMGKDDHSLMSRAEHHLYLTLMHNLLTDETVRRLEDHFAQLPKAADGRVRASVLRSRSEGLDLGAPVLRCRSGLDLAGASP